MPTRAPAPKLAERSPMLLSEQKAVPRGGWHFEIKYKYVPSAVASLPTLPPCGGRCVWETGVLRSTQSNFRPIADVD